MNPIPPDVLARGLTYDVYRQRISANAEVFDLALLRAFFHLGDGGS